MPACHPAKSSHDHAACGHNHDHLHDHAHSPQPAARQRVRLGIPAGSIRSELRIVQMDCPTEETLIRKKLGDMASVQGLEFNLMQRVLTVVHTANALPSIDAAIRELGMTPVPLTAAVPAAPTAAHWPQLLAGLLALGAEVAHWVGGPAWLVAVLALAAVTGCGLGTYKKGWIALRNGNLNINALMSIAVTGALMLGQWPEAAMVMFLFNIAELIEAKSLDRARNAIHGLLQLTPEKASVQQQDGSWTEVDAKSVAIGSVARVKPGERIALDGVIVAGRSVVNQAPITGESLPVEKSEGDPGLRRHDQRIRLVRLPGECRRQQQHAGAHHPRHRGSARQARARAAFRRPVRQSVYPDGVRHCARRGNRPTLAARRCLV